MALYGESLFSRECPSHYRGWVTQVIKAFYKELTMRHLALLTLLTLVLALAGCGGTATPPPAPTPASAAEALLPPGATFGEIRGRGLVHEATLLEKPGVTVVPTVTPYPTTIPTATRTLIPSPTATQIPPATTTPMPPPPPPAATVAAQPQQPICDGTIAKGDTVKLTKGCIISGDIKIRRPGTSNFTNLFDDRERTGLLTVLDEDAEVCAPFGGASYNTVAWEVTYNKMRTEGCGPGGCTEGVRVVRWPSVAVIRER